MSWGPGLYLCKHSGGVTSVYLSVGRGQPVMINPGLSQRMRPPLYEGLGYSVSPLCSPRAPHQVLGPVAQSREPGRCCLSIPGYGQSCAPTRG